MSTVLPSSAEKSRYVSEMFGRIAARYDLMNTLMTGGQDAAWRRRVADEVRRSGATRVLDVGTGTGGLARAIAAAVPSAQVIGVDFTLPMLRRARGTVAAADALDLPFGAANFDAVVSGFLIRNLADAAAGIDEQLRVLRRGGLMVVLETTPGPRGLLGTLYRGYFRRVVPSLGGLIAGDDKAYTYLPESTLAFLEPAHLAALIRERGLTEVNTRRMALGAVAITTARKS